ncbi:MAG TPA: hypothetical protein VN380_13530 [Thermoanaerobaculia bacterium]|jgi:hypothetical protein|nr:hypothetical protein [Thermoanaerobaculia bacterium]
MSLLARYRSLLEATSGLFAQQRTARRSVEFSLAMPASVGRHTITNALSVLGRTQVDWSGAYKFFSRSRWNQAGRFRPVFEHYLQMFPSGPIAIAVDDTKAHKVGKKIRSAFWQRDPLSPPFHANLIWAQRFLHFSLIFPLHRNGLVPARSLPVRFEDAPALKKPGIRGSLQQWEAYRQQVKQTNLSTQARTTAEEIRKHLDQLGQAHRSLLLPVDGSFCNRRFFREPLDRTYILARARKDARLCFPAPAGSRRRYDANLFTPEAVRKDDSIPWHKATVFFGGKRRKVRFKVVNKVLWRRGSGLRTLRLIVLAPTPYRLSPNASINYRDPAYLLTDELASSLTSLLQSYFDRWQIEVNHREIKQHFGAGQAQVRALLSVPRVPAFVVSCYSLLHLAGLLEFGSSRIDRYSPLPIWRRASTRPSIADLLRLLRTDLNETRDSTSGLQIPAANLVLSPAA